MWKFSLEDLKRRRGWDGIRFYIFRSTLKVIDNGSSRMVFALNKKTVLKLAFCKVGIAQNKTEYRVTKQTKGTKWEKYIARVVDNHPKYYWIISERCDKNNFCYSNHVEDYRLLCDLCNKYKILSADVAKHNCGILNGVLVLLDYGCTESTFYKYYCKY